MLGRLRYWIGRRLAEFRLSRLLRRTAETATAPQQVFEAASSVALEGITIQPIQVRSEIEALLAVVRDHDARRILEIGTANGGTLYLLTWASAPSARILSLDIRDFDSLRRRLFESFGHAGKKVALMQADSHLETTRDAVARFFGDPIDVLFIDGDHSGESVRRDYELSSPLVRSGGLIVFHDIVDGPEELVGGVPVFWREVRSELADPVELVESWTQGGFGIAVGRKR